ncbi:N-acyl-L-amino acid amidohydrolase [Planococcus antarcticus DSM 14505]|uniref:N-acyl-L-amino acid amidohydrolase n=1 Tax=Planococcus antarcticus DSM 14505 TaxID=1185653 RepID=A0AA87IKY6_9BACL|nr:M20 family metallopeptidase [Planococcus antarcticus]EIM06364.1 N-acyl-L-amino acid amidohydrolase [Planococcus antarcticus DSM 14505]
MAEHHLVVRQANSIAGKLIEWRRTFHRFPELSFQEFGTSHYIAETLQEIDGIKVDTGIGVETSVIGTLTSGEGPTIAIRADIDALPIEEENDTDYRSQNPGVMHACGHDAHSAILLGTATILAKQFKEKGLKGTVKFIFQPAEECIDEEGMSGSPYLVQAGVYDGVDVAIALHMCPWLPVGEVQIHDGYSMANVDVFQAKIKGTGGHGAYPELGTDPTWMLGPVLQALHGIVSRKVPPLEAAVVSIGQIHAGTASNIIPTEVEIEGTIRSYSSEIRELLSNEIEKAFSVTEKLGGEYSLEIQKGEPALVNNPAVNDRFLKAIHETYPDLRITKKPFGMGGEDFGYVTHKLPGSMFFLGSALPNEVQRDLHTPFFDIDESCLPKGVAILVQTALNFLTEEKSIIGK